MGNYIFFIGGSGARACKAFLHCCAAGIVQKEEVKIILLDADRQNDANNECKKLYHMYKNQYDLLRSQALEKYTSSIGVYKCNVEMYIDEAISPLPNEECCYLEQVVRPNSVELRAMKWLYTKKEREQPLEKGFYGRPNIGCVFFQNFQNEYLLQCVNDMVGELSNDKEVNLVLVGSVFGGTGASGIPSVLKYIYGKLREDLREEKFTKFHTCGVMLTPYFKIMEPDKTSNDIIINHREFWLNTREAILYYKFFKSATAENQEHFQSIFLVGQNTMDFVNSRYIDGGKDQKNKSHIVELLTARAINDFLQDPSQNKIKGHIIDVQTEWNWNLFPESLFLADLFKVQVILANDIFPYVFEQKEKTSSIRMIMVPQWYKVYHLCSSENTNFIEKLNDYSLNMLRWGCELQMKIDSDGSCKYNERIHLFEEKLVNGIREQIVYIGNKDTEKQERKKIREHFNEIIDLTANVEYALDKVVLILSFLGIVPRALADGGCAGLLIKLFELIGERN